MRNIISLLFILLTSLVTGCSMEKDIDRMAELNGYEVLNTKAEITEEDFIYRLVSDKAEYQKDDVVRIYAELEYIGDKDEITIYHAASPFYFPMIEISRDYVIEYPMNEPLLRTTLKKGEAIREEYRGSGGYSSEDEKEYVNFMKSIIDNQFPVGYYVVNGLTNFYVSAENDQEVEKTFNIKAKIDFKVTVND